MVHEKTDTSKQAWTKTNRGRSPSSLDIGPFGPCRTGASRRLPRPAIAHVTPSQTRKHLPGVHQSLNYLADSYRNPCIYEKPSRRKKGSFATPSQITPLMMG
jgi:hypothetical protein